MHDLNVHFPYMCHIRNCGFCWSGTLISQGIIPIRKLYGNLCPVNTIPRPLFPSPDFSVSKYRPAKINRPFRFPVIIVPPRRHVSFSDTHSAKIVKFGKIQKPVNIFLKTPINSYLRTDPIQTAVRLLLQTEN